MLMVFLCACSGDPDTQRDTIREVDTLPEVDAVSECPPANLELTIWSASGPELETFVGAGTVDHGEVPYDIVCAESGSTKPDQFTCQQAELPGGSRSGALNLVGDFDLKGDSFLIDVLLSDASGNYFQGELTAVRGFRPQVPEPEGGEVLCPHYWASIVLRDPSKDVVCTNDAPPSASPSSDTCLVGSAFLSDTCADAPLICAEGEYQFSHGSIGEVVDDFAWPCGCPEPDAGADGRGLVDGVVAFIPPVSATYRMRVVNGVPAAPRNVYVVTECGSAAPACLAATDSGSADVELEAGLKYYLILDGLWSNHGGTMFQFSITRL